jgi:hypothetical protein
MFITNDEKIMGGWTNTLKMNALAGITILVMFAAVGGLLFSMFPSVSANRDPEGPSKRKATGVVTGMSARLRPLYKGDRMGLGRWPPP